MLEKHIKKIQLKLEDDFHVNFIIELAVLADVFNVKRREAFRDIEDSGIVSAFTACHNHYDWGSILYRHVFRMFMRNTKQRNNTREMSVSAQDE